MATDQTEQSLEFWRKKCQDQEEIIKSLTGHCVQVIKKHEELLISYQKTQDQYYVLVERLKDQKEQVKKAREVLGPVTREYQELKEKYEIAIRCQQEAETFATKMNVSNQNLKRQSQMIFTKLQSGQNIVDINIDEPVDNGEDESKKYIESMESKIRELSDEKASLSASVKELNEDLEVEKENSAALKKKLEEYKKDLKSSNERVSRQGKELLQLAKTSEEAIQEYKSLQEQYETEYLNHQATDKVAQRLKAESAAAKRQSAALMCNITGDQKLMKALVDIGDLTQQLETVKSDYQDKVQILEESLKEERERSGIQDLEDERDALLQKLTDSEKEVSEARSLYTNLQEKYSELEKKYEKALNEPRIPVPPPPPPPPPPPAQRTGILALIAGSKKKKKEMIKKRLDAGGAAVNQDWNQALEEMMKRIKDGKPLKPVLKSRTAGVELASKENGEQSLPEENSAVSELEGILKKMKKSKSVEDLTEDQDTFADKDSELSKVFQKVVQKRQDQPDEAAAAAPVRVPAPAPKPRAYPRKLSTVKDVEEEEEEP